MRHFAAIGPKSFAGHDIGPKHVVRVDPSLLHKCRLGLGHDGVVVVGLRGLELHRCPDNQPAAFRFPQGEREAQGRPCQDDGDDDVVAPPDVAKDGTQRVVNVGADPELIGSKHSLCEAAHKGSRSCPSQWCASGALWGPQQDKVFAPQLDNEEALLFAVQWDMPKGIRKIGDQPLELADVEAPLCCKELKGIDNDIGGPRECHPLELP